MALVALAVGVGIVALVDFGGIAGQGIRVGQFVLALAPWVLVLRAGSVMGQQRVLEGAVAIGWALLLAGAIGDAFALKADSVLSTVAAAIQALGAVLVLVVLYRSGHFGRLSFLVLLSVGIFGGSMLGAATLQPEYLPTASLVSSFLIATHLVPQLVHDVAVTMWGSRTGAWDRVHVSLEGVGMPFILWTLAGHLIIAPAILLWSSKPNVLFGGVGAVVSLMLFGVRGGAGLFSGRAVVGVTGVAVIYGLGLALLVRGGRPY